MSELKTTAFVRTPGQGAHWKVRRTQWHHAVAFQTMPIATDLQALERTESPDALQLHALDQAKPFSLKRPQHKAPSTSRRRTKRAWE